MSAKKLTVLFIPLDGYGHVNACIGVGQQLAARGHRVVFALEQAWKGKVSKYPGLEETYYVDKSRDPSIGANDHWIGMMAHIKHTFKLDPIEALKQSPMELMNSFFFNFFNVHKELVKIIADVKPDVIVEDTYVTIPAAILSGIPRVWITSAQPLTCLPDPNLPPAKTGYPTNGDRAQWKAYLYTAMSLMGELAQQFNNRLRDEFNLPPPPPGTFCHPSEHLNMYSYPREVDYLDIRPLPPTWQQFDHFVRVQEVDPNFKIPEEFIKNSNGKLIYVSMGSMGCADMELMSRLIEILKESPNRFIFSLGPLEGQLKPLLGANMWGARFVPQTNVLKLVDLVITHGGNNTFVEALYYGKPMIVTPLFADQLDNAQRITEVGLGFRVNAFTVEPEDFLVKIETLLNDEDLNKRLKNISKRLQEGKSTEKAAIAIEKVVQ